MRVYMALPLLMTPLLSACGDATGLLVGGDPLTTMTPSEAGTAPTGEGGIATNQTNPDCIPGGNGAHPGNTWSDLYACYFGPSGTDSCAGTGNSCHGNPAAMGGSFWNCGMTSDSCYQGMTGYPALMIMSSQSSPTMAHLYNVVCSVTGQGYMPLGCSVPSETLESGDLARIAAWIGAGASEN
jgi:hypothetical protein